MLRKLTGRQSIVLPPNKDAYDPKLKKRPLHFSRVLPWFLLLLLPMIPFRRRTEDVATWKTTYEKIHDVWKFNNLCVSPLRKNKWAAHILNAALPYWERSPFHFDNETRFQYDKIVEESVIFAHGDVGTHSNPGHMLWDYFMKFWSTDLLTKILPIESYFYSQQYQFNLSQSKEVISALTKFIFYS